MIKKTLKAWSVFIFGLIILFAVDYFSRIHDGNVRTPFIPESIYFLIQILIIMVSIYLLIKGSKKLEILIPIIATYGYQLFYQLYKAIREHKMLLHIFYLCLQLALGFCIYVMMGLFYVCHFGIDCM